MSSLTSFRIPALSDILLSFCAGTLASYNYQVYIYYCNVYNDNKHGNHIVQIFKVFPQLKLS